MQPNAMPPGWCGQLRLLMSKNLLLKWRAKRSTVLEILVPLIILLMLTVFRSLTSIATTQENLYIDQALPLGDPQLLGSMLYATACGAKDAKGARTTDAVSFAISSNDDAIMAKMTNHIKSTMHTMVSLANPVTLGNTSSMDCTDEPLICRFPNNKDAAQCKGPFTITSVNLTQKINSEKFVLEFSSRAELEAYVQKPTYGANLETPPFIFGVSFMPGAGTPINYSLPTQYLFSVDCCCF